MKGLLEARNLRSGRLLAAQVEKAEGLKDRMVGLLGRRELPPGQGLWIVPCPQVHTFFMRFTIDVLFLDKERRVVGWAERMAPWRVSAWHLKAHSALELTSGALEGQVEKGDVVEFTANG